MKPVTEPILCAAASAFDFGGPMVCDPHHYGEGHINDTFVVWRADHTKRFILQRINTDTFTDPAGLMENICGVTQHLRAKIQAEGGDPGRECLNVIPTLSGAAYYIDSEGNAWRAYDFVENTGSSLSSYQSGTLTLYFANKKGDKLVEQKMDVRYSSNVPKEKLIVEKLMQGPTGNGAYPTINPDTNLLSVTIKDHVCYVNFDSTFLTSVYDVLPEITIYSLVDSIIAGTEATQVQITINGETKAVYMEKIDLSQPLEKDMDWVAVNDDE